MGGSTPKEFDVGILNRLLSAFAIPGNSSCCAVDRGLGGWRVEAEVKVKMEGMEENLKKEIY